MGKLLIETSERLSRSQAVTQILDIGLTTSPLTEMFATTLFLIQLNFLVSHEFSHHALRHVAEAFGDGLTIRKEIHESTLIAAIKEQAEEVGADTFAVYLVLSNLFNGDGKDSALNVLTFGGKPAENVDKALLGLFTIAVCAFFYAFPSARFDSTKVYQRNHPPTDLRMNYVMHSVTSWCEQNRPTLEKWMDLSRYQAYMRAAIEAIYGAMGRPNWDAQILFLKSPAGKEYLALLEKTRLQQFALLKTKS